MAVLLLLAVAGTGASGADAVASWRDRSSGRLVDLDWLTAKHGWALVDRMCSGTSGHCLAVYATRDGGRSWRRLTAANAFGCSRAYTCVNGIRFATSRIGFLYGPRSFASADGGRSWAPRLRSQVESIAVSGGLVFQLVYFHSGCPGPCSPRLVVLSPQLLGVRTVRRWPRASGFGEQLVSGGTNLYVIFYGHPAGGAGLAHAKTAVSHDRGKTWSQVGDPCGGSGLHENDASAIAAAGHFVAVLCLPRTGRGRAFVALSDNAGTTFRKSSPVAVPGAAQLAVSVQGAIAVGNGGASGAGRFEYKLALSRDDGRSWRIAVHERESVGQEIERAPLQFVDERDLSWVGPAHFVWLSSDAGRSWRKLPAP